MENENDKKNAGTPNKPENEGPKPLAIQERLKLTNELSMKLAPLTQGDQRTVLSAVAAALGVSSSAGARPQQQQQQRQPNRSGGR